MTKNNGDVDVMERVLNKLNTIDTRLNSMDVTMVKQQSSLEEHMRRSVANEEAIEILKTELKPVILNMEVAKITLKVIFSILGSAAMVELIRFTLERIHT